MAVAGNGDNRRRERRSIDRALQRNLELAIQREGCALLVGPYEVGKSELAKRIVQQTGARARFLNGRNDSDRNALSGDTGLVRNSAGMLIVIDEIHAFPEGLDLIHSEVEAAIDQGKPIGHFLVLGSATLDAERLTAQRLGTRFETFRLAPINLSELPSSADPGYREARTVTLQPLEATSPITRSNEAISLETLWLRGGFPGSLLAGEDEDSFGWRERYLMALCQRGYAQINPGLSFGTTREFLERIANFQGEAVSPNRLPSEQRPLVGHFEDLGLLRRLRPWHARENKRFDKEPKLYIRDTGLLHSLLKRRSLAEIRADDRILGHSWEGFCIENLIAAAGSSVLSFFCRFDDKDEVDLLLEYPNGVRWAIEIKAGTTRVSDGFDRAANMVGASNRFVVRYAPESSVGGRYRELTLRDAMASVTRGPQ